MSSTHLSDPRHGAVVVIDMANDFIHAGGTIADAGGPEYQARARSIIPGLARLLEAARSAGMTVVYATDAHRPDDDELRKWPPHAMQGTSQADIVEELTPQAGDVVFPKRTYSPFLDPGFDAMLRQRGIRTLYVTGLHTDCCCRHTSGDAFQRGYDLVWVTDAMQAFTDEQHRSGLEYYRTWYATDADRQFVTVDDLVEELSGAPAAP